MRDSCGRFVGLWTAGLLVSTSFHLACTGCRAAGCDGEVSVTARSSMPLKPGTYTVTFALSGAAYEASCTIADTTQGSRCDDPETDELHFVHLEVSPDRNEESESDDNAHGQLPPHRISLSAFIMEDDDVGMRQVGPLPRELDFELQYEGAVLVSEALKPKIRRQEDFNGRGCGICETSEAIELSLTQR